MTPGICPYCSKDCKNLGSHLVYCKSKPHAIQDQIKTIEYGKAMKQDTILDTTTSLNPAEPTSLPKAEPKTPWYSKLFSKKQPEEKKPADIKELLNNLPKWSIRDKPPFFMSSSEKAKLIQFVGVSRTKPPVMCWLKWDGIWLSTNDRMYQPPHDIRGNVFFYDLDNSIPLLDNLRKDEEAHESLRMAQVKNIAYAMGRVAGAQDLLKNLGLILLGVVAIFLILALDTYMTYKVSTGYDVLHSQVSNISYYVHTRP